MEVIKTITLEIITYTTLIGLLMLAFMIVFMLSKVIWNWLTNPSSMYIYGTCNDTIARKHRTKGNVQFIIFKKGEQSYVDGIGHTYDKWVNFDSSHWNNFIKNKQ